MRVLIADDDSASRKLLKHFIGALPNFQIVGEAADGEELIHYVSAEKPDIALVDIDMPLLNGLEAIKYCKGLFPFLQVIFTTGHDNYALEAFNISVADYVLKPIDRNRLYVALGRATQAYDNLIGMKNVYKRNLMIKQQKEILFIPLDDIIFIERIDRKSVIHTINKKFETNEALNSLEGSLDSRFILSHRSYIINLRFLTRIKVNSQMYEAYFQDYNETARVSKHKLPELQNCKIG